MRSQASSTYNAVVKDAHATLGDGKSNPNYLKSRTLLMQLREKLVALFRRQVENSLYQLNAEIKRLAPGLGMGTDQRVYGARKAGDLIFTEFEVLVFVIVTMLCTKAVETPPLFFRQGLISSRHIREPGVAASVLGYL